MKKNNNKGSSLILVIVLFAVLFTIGGATLMVLNTNYKARVKEGRRLQNLYESDAGLDVAYNIVVKTFEAGIASGSESVSNISEDELKDLDTKQRSEKINDVFKYGFKKVVNKEELKKSIEETKYVKDYKVKTEEDRYQIIKFNNDDNKEKPKLQCEVPEPDNDKYEITVVSEFETDETKSSTGKNLRKVQVVYTVEVPDYEDAVVVEPIKKIEYPQELKGKVIGVDGNMDIKNDASLSLNITGDMFVKGENKYNTENYNIVYDKYTGGITFDTNSAMHFILNGNLITANTFNISNKVGHIATDITGDVYAGNIYIGSKDGQYSNSNDTNINGKVVIDNDLAMKGKGTKLSIKEFYGINDKKYQTEFPKENNFETKTRNSSSIIVNGNNGSSIKITDKAYIMGTAYIDVQNNNGSSYQTGESVAIKGNYIAYTKQLKEFKDYDFDTYGPLQLVDSKNGKELSIDQKNEYFKTFVDNYSKPGEIKDGGVVLPKDSTYAIGAVVYKDNNNLIVEKSNYNEDMDNTIINKREEYAEEVYSMGSLDAGTSAKDVYDKLGEYQKTVGSVVKFDNKKENYESDELVLNHDSSKTVVLTDNKDYIKKNNEIVVKVDTDKDINMLILTNGNVEVKTKSIRNYNGAIISTQAIKFDTWNGAGQITMKYDEAVIKKIISKHKDKLEGVFEISSVSNFSKVQNSVKVQNSIPVYNHQYDIKKYVKSKQWKILK